MKGSIIGFKIILVATMNNTIKNVIEESKLIVIVRRIYGEQLLELAKAMELGGIKLMEVTYDQSDPDCLNKTTAAIEMLCNNLGDKMHFGVGTVLNSKQVRAAEKAGARFIISPNTSQEVIDLSKKLNLISIPGAMTPSEMATASKLGADYIKVFPASFLGLKYIKDILAPLSHIKLIATGGVNEDNFGDYIDAGFYGAGISGRLTDKKLVEQGNFMELSHRAKNFVEIVQSKGGRA